MAPEVDLSWCRREWLKDKQIDRQTQKQKSWGWVVWALWASGLQHHYLRNSVCLSYMVKWRGRVIVCSWTRSHSFYKQINKEIRFMVNSCIKETGLANFSGRRLCRRTYLGVKARWAFSAHTVDIYTWTGRKDFAISLSLVWGEGFDIFPWVWGLGVCLS